MTMSAPKTRVNFGGTNQPKRPGEKGAEHDGIKVGDAEEESSRGRIRKNGGLEGREKKSR